MKKEKIIIAHRGARGISETENSIESFENTIKVGGTWVELDVRKTKDSRFIVFHDKYLNGKPISELNFSQIKKKRNEVETLDTILGKFKGKLKFDIEIKEEGDEKEIVDIIKKHLYYKEYFVSSFSEKIVTKIKKIDNNIRTGLLIDKEKGFLKKIFSFFPCLKVRRVKVDYLISHISTTKFFFFLRMKIFKRKLIVWSVDSEKDIKKILKKPLMGIITDRPDLGVKRINSFTKRG